MTEQELKFIELMVANELEEPIERVFMTISSSMESLKVLSTLIESSINNGSIIAIEGIMISKGFNTKLMPYKNSLDSLYKSLYDLKLKVLDDIKEIQEIQATANL